MAPIDVGSTFEMFHNILGDLLKRVKEEYLLNEKINPARVESPDLEHMHSAIKLFSTPGMSGRMPGLIINRVKISKG